MWQQFGTGPYQIGFLAGREITDDQLARAAGTCWGILEAAAPGKFIVATLDPSGPWAVRPGAAPLVRVFDRPILWWHPPPLGFTPVWKRVRNHAIRDVCCYVTAYTSGNDPPDFEVAGLRAAHEFYHYHTPNPDPNDDHTDDPTNVMCGRGTGPRKGATFNALQAAVLLGVT